MEPFSPRDHLSPILLLYTTPEKHLDTTEMTGVDLEKCKRIVQYFWDPEPKNDTAPETSIWCLGQQYNPRPEELDDASTGMSCFDP